MSPRKPSKGGLPSSSSATSSTSRSSSSSSKASLPEGGGGGGGEEEEIVMAAATATTTITPKAPTVDIDPAWDAMVRRRRKEAYEEGRGGGGGGGGGGQGTGLRHVCEMNNLSQESFVNRADQVETLEIFMTMPVELSILRYFTGLRSLKVMKQPEVVALSGLEEARELEELWVSECSLEAITGLDRCASLTKLILTNNRIPRIENLHHVTRLTTLWLCDNQLTSLVGLESLVHLTELWACRNKIQYIGSSLARNTRLRELNLADNRIGCFKEILALSSLRSLESLTLCDPHYGANPVCQLCNYQTLVIFHLTQLNKLDMRLVTDKSKHMAQSIFLKKRMYYEMRVRTLKRNAGNLTELAESFLHAKSGFLRESSQSVAKHLKDCDWEVDELKTYGLPTPTPVMPPSLAHKPSTAPAASLGENTRGRSAAHGHAPSTPTACAMTASSTAAMMNGGGPPNTGPSFDTGQAIRIIEERKRVLNKIEGIIDNRLVTMDMSLESTREAIQQVASKMIDNLMLEFNTGGNIRLEEGSEKDSWFGTFRNFVSSSFNPKDYEGYGIANLDVTRIIRVHNRLLRQRFDARVKSVMKTLATERVKGGTEDAPSHETAGGKPIKPATAVEYLFLRIQEPYIDELEDWLHRTAEEGFRPSHSFSPAIRLSTTIWDADFDRLRKQSREIRNGVKDLLDSSLVGTILVLKIYRGRCRDIEVTEEEFRRVYQSGQGISPALFPGFQSLSIKIVDRSSPRQWYMLDPTLAVPEFIVEYEYLRRGETFPPPMVPTITSCLTSSATATSPEGLTPSGEATTSSSSTASSSSSSKPSNEKGGVPLDARLQALWKLLESSGTPTTCIKLPAEDQGTDLRPFSLPVLRFARKVDFLVSSYARLHLTEQQTVLETDVRTLIGARVHPPLVEITESGLFSFTRASNLSSLLRLSLHSQGLQNIQNLDSCHQLRALTLSFNQITRIEGLAKLIHLQSLDLGFNLIHKIEGLEGMAKLASLNLQNNLIKRVDDADAIGEHLPCLTDFNIRDNPIARTKKCRIIFLNAFPSLQVLNRVRMGEVERAEVLNNSRCLSIEQIYKQAVRRKKVRGLGQPSHEDNAPVAGHAALNPSAPTPSTRLQWLEDLEELLLDNQGIQRLQSLDLLPNLRRASFAHNDISSMEGLQPCFALEELSLEGNRITVIDCLTACTRLKRLDLGSNTISSVRGMETLAGLTQLSLENNQLSSLSGLEHLVSLMELYMANNLLGRTGELDSLHSLGKLIILDLSGNPMCQTPQYRTYTIFRLRSLKVLDGRPVTSREMGVSQKIFEGKLTQDMLREKLQPNTYDDIQVLNLSSCRLKDVDILGAGELDKLRELVLDNNSLSSFSWAKGLGSLVLLSLKNNRIESFFPGGHSSSRSNAARDQANNPANSNSNSSGFLFPSAAGVMLNLETLLLSQNRIADLRDLELYHFPKLAFLHASDNELSQVLGLHHCIALQCLVLDQNKIRQLDPNSFCGLIRLRELRMRDNGLRSLSHFKKLPNLEVLNLSNNRVSTLAELEKLGASETHQPLDVNLQGNPVCRKSRYRAALIYLFPTLTTLDGRVVSEDEKERAITLISPAEMAVTKRFTLDHKLGYEKDRPSKVCMSYVTISEDLRFGNLQDEVFPVSDPITGYGRATLTLNRFPHESNNNQSLAGLPPRALRK